jgi:hypothetical protein
LSRFGGVRLFWRENGATGNLPPSVAGGAVAVNFAAENTIVSNTVEPPAAA